MPTGYTADVANGKISDFPTFAMQCARAFGALVTMRDEPLSAPVPVFEPSDFHIEALLAAQARLDHLNAMSSDEIVSARNAEEAERQKRDDERETNRAQQEDRYRSMLAAVDAWEPPTKDHVDMRAFMRSQLIESINSDCRPWETEPLPSPSLWHQEMIKQAEKDMNYHQAKYEKEVTSVRSRNQWVADLRASLTS